MPSTILLVISNGNSSAKQDLSKTDSVCETAGFLVTAKEEQTNIKKVKTIENFTTFVIIIVYREKYRTSILDLPLHMWLLWKRKIPDHADRSKASSFQNCFYLTYAFA